MTGSHRTRDGLDRVYAPVLGRHVYLRPGTADERVFSDTFTGLYHVPPPFEPSPQTVIDIGAHVGLVSAHYRVLWPDARVVAVEMDPGAFDLLRRNAPGVEMRQHAVAGRSGYGSFLIQSETDARAFMPRGDVGQRVYASTLRHTVVAAFGGAECDFAKVDVEGAEWGILRDAPAWAPVVRRLLIELHDASFPRLMEVKDEPIYAGRDGPSHLLDVAVWLLEGAGYRAVPHAVHPAAVWAVRE